MVDGEAIFSCLTPVVALQRWSITTVEGIGTERNPSPLQRALSRSRRRSAAIAPPA
jgi:aerobic-type carbon monoxide dehydrogenase small subunit (CoxS/CutS family)